MVSAKKDQQMWRWRNYILASELFKEQASQSTYNIHPDLSQDAHSVTKFGDEIRWWKFSDENPWQKFSEIFDCWARMMLVRYVDH